MWSNCLGDILITDCWPTGEYVGARQVAFLAYVELGMDGDMDNKNNC